MEQKITVEGVRGWFIDLIKEFRDSIEKLSEAEKHHLTNAFDYRTPCQIEVFWVNHPIEMQLVIVSHDQERPDQDILVHEPCAIHEFLTRAEKIASQPQWIKSVPNKIRLPGYPENVKRVDSLILVLEGFVGNLKTLIFTNIGKGQMSGTIFGANEWCFSINGTVFDIRKNTIIEQTIKDAKRDASIVPITKQPRKIEPGHNLKGFGTYFYPPIWIGEIPEPSFQQKVTNSQLLFPTPLLNIKLEELAIIVNTDGFIGIQTTDRIKALQMLNVIFGLGYLQGENFLSARESDITQIEINPADSRVVLAISTKFTERNQINYWVFEGRHHQRKEVPKAKIADLIESAGKIFKKADLTEEVAFLLETYTHHQDSEFSQAFVMGWIIIEKHLFTIWQELIQEKKITGKRKDKLINTLLWDADRILETLHLNGKINETDYALLSELKTKRNDFIHKGKLIDGPAAKQLLEFTCKIVKEKII